jgi:hypothetical protein
MHLCVVRNNEKRNANARCKQVPGKSPHRYWRWRKNKVKRSHVLTAFKSTVKRKELKISSSRPHSVLQKRPQWPATLKQASNERSNIIIQSTRLLCCFSHCKNYSRRSYSIIRYFLLLIVLREKPALQGHDGKSRYFNKRQPI